MPLELVATKGLNSSSLQALASSSQLFEVILGVQIQLSLSL